MPQPPPPFSQAPPENNCPVCLSIKLEGRLIQAEKQGIFNLKTKSAATNQIQLYLALQFNEQEEPLPGRCLKFGIKGGKLKLRVDNGELSLASPGLKGAFELSGEPGRYNPESSNYQSGFTVYLRERKPELQPSLEALKTVRKEAQAQLAVSGSRTQGLQENLTWVFAGEKDNSILQGSFNRTLLGTLRVKALPCRVEAIFCVSPEDIYITDAAGLIPHRIGKKKKVIIHRAIARHLLKRKLKPYLSRQELRYDG
jgi:hypothetical protein